MKKKINIFGLGFVGYPLMLLLANIKRKGKSSYDVTGIETNNVKKKFIEKFLKKGQIPFNTTDKKLSKLARTNFSKSIKILTNNELSNIGGIILICINFDGLKKLNELKSFFKILANKIDPKSIIIIETTLLPGTCEKILYPIIKRELNKRNLNINKLSFGYSFERIMPGKNYLNSIINNFKSIAGINNTSKKKILNFYKSFLNYKKFPITIFEKITECETAKIMENSYRSVNISFIDEWNKFAYNNKLNLKKIINSIKLRDTHSNIMRPGIGVGGYCLTKDPIFGEASSRKIFKKKISFPISTSSVKINKQMPNFCFKLIKSKIKKSSKILLIGSSYKNNISDLRLSPSIDLFRKFTNAKFKITNIDPMVDRKKFLSIYPRKIKNYDVIIFSVPHDYFKKNLVYNEFNSNNIIFDLDYVLNQKQIKKLKNNKIKIFSLGDFSE